MDHKADLQHSGLSILVRLTLKESALLKLLRTKRFSRIEIELKNGEVGQVYADEEIPTTGAKPEDILDSSGFQTITFTQHDGNTVRIKRRVPMKLD